MPNILVQSLLYTSLVAKVSNCDVTTHMEKLKVLNVSLNMLPFIRTIVTHKKEDKIQWMVIDQHVHWSVTPLSDFLFFVTRVTATTDTQGSL